jgi:hypothetical protein
MDITLYRKRKMYGYRCNVHNYSFDLSCSDRNVLGLSIAHTLENILDEKDSLDFKRSRLSKSDAEVVVRNIRNSASYTGYGINLK